MTAKVLPDLPPCCVKAGCKVSYRRDFRDPVLVVTHEHKGMIAEGHFTDLLLAHDVTPGLSVYCWLLGLHDKALPWVFEDGPRENYDDPDPLLVGEQGEG